MSDEPVLAAIAKLGVDLRGEIVTSRTEIMARIDRMQECFVNYAAGEGIGRRVDNTREEQRELREQISGLVRQVRMLRDRLDALEGP